MDSANFQRVEDDLYCGGQPTEAELSALLECGVRSLINLRPPGEFDGYDDALAAARLGLQYTQIPISGSVDLTRENIARFCQALADARTRGGVLVYCRSGNRVGAAFALAEAWSHQCCPEVALARGRRTGMTTLEAAVSAMLRDAR